MLDVIRAFKALSDETRLRILNLLLERECCVCEIMQALGISQTRASRNLGILHQAGFLKLRRRGTWSLYSVDKTSLFSSQIARAVRRKLKDNPLLGEDLDKLKGAERKGPASFAT